MGSKKAGCCPAFLSLGENGREGSNDVQATDREAGQTEELSALQSRENRRERALPALPLQAAGAHAPAAGGNRHAGGVGGGRRAARGSELLRHPLQVDPDLSGGTNP